MTGPSAFVKLKALRKPRLRADRRVDIIGDNVFLSAESRHFIVEGAAAVKIVPLLDGTRTADEIAGELAGDMSLAEVLRVLGRFAELGHLVDAGSGPDDLATAWWDGTTIGLGAATERLGKTTIAVAHAGPASAGAAGMLADLLSDTAGVEVSISGADGAPGDIGTKIDVTVVCADDYLHPDLDSINSAAIAVGTPWFLARVVGAQVWLGPFFVPGRTACWRCLAQRLASNRQVERFVDTSLRDGVHGDGAQGDAWVAPSPAAAIASSVAAGAGMVATEVLRLMAAGPGAASDPTFAAGTLGAVVTLHLRTWESERHPVVAQPQCPACGDPARAQRTSPVVLSPQPSAYTGDGGHRVCSPAETVERLERHVSPLTGAISKLHRLTAPGDEISHAYAAGHNFALFARSVSVLRRNLRGVSGGKGRSDIQARASAMSEAIERYSGVWRGDEPATRSTYAQLSDSAVHPEELLGFSQRQYEQRNEWNPRQISGNHVVPEPFDEEREISWSKAWSLTQDELRHVPTLHCYYGHPDGAVDPFCFADSNGNAAGNTLEEAILQGLLEVVERDAVAIWWYNELRVPGVELSSFGDPYIDLLLDHYAAMGRDLWMLDITNDIGIPVFVVVSRRLDHPVEDIIVASGAHLEPRLAALRALTECNQYLPMLAERDVEGNTVYFIDDPEATAWWAGATLAGEPYLSPDPGTPARTASSIEDLSCSDITKEVMTGVERIASAGMEVLVFDQTRPDLDLNVVKVIAPGMRHFWRRLGPGRLYEVPLRIGLLDTPRDESDLNSKSVFY